jgi:hypothetical protein
MNRPCCVIRASREQTRLFLRWGSQELLRAALPPPGVTHPRAASVLLEGLSLWTGQSLRVVLCADAKVDSSALGLCDGFGFGNENLHYSVEVIEPGRRLSMGTFRDLRQMSLRGLG